jgi:hypothetical protein
VAQRKIKPPHQAASVRIDAGIQIRKRKRTTGERNRRKRGVYEAKGCAILTNKPHQRADPLALVEIVMTFDSDFTRYSHSPSSWHCACTDSLLKKGVFAVPSDKLKNVRARFVEMIIDPSDKRA